MVIIAGFGNPLLDITVKTNCKQLLQKYNLKDDDQREVDDITMKSLLDDIKDLPVEYNPGGSVQNTLRIFQWLCGKSETAYMIGGIGKDENGEILKRLVENAGVETRYVLNNQKSTGITIAIINQENRSLVASIGAAKQVTSDLLQKITNNFKLLSKVDLFYMEGFFIPNREECVKYILDFSKQQNKLFAFNISAPYICQENKNDVEHFAENCDILFGNMIEYETLIQATNFQGSVVDYALYLNSKNINENWKYRKMIIITNGSKKVVCIHSKGEINNFEVPKLSTKEIVDTTGAGDSFVAGFVLGLFKNHTPHTCLKYGCWAAQQIIKHIGCKTPDYVPEINTIVEEM